jgi:hypothetical protein
MLLSAKTRIKIGISALAFDKDLADTESRIPGRIENYGSYMDPRDVSDVYNPH